MGKLGRPRLFKSTDELWDLFDSYREITKMSPRRKMVFKGKDGTKDYEELETPLTIEGFKNYARRRVGCVEQYLQNNDNLYPDFISISRAIKDEIRQDQIEGGMVGQYNPSITARLNSLTEKQEIKQEVTSNQLEVVVKRMDK